MLDRQHSANTGEGTVKYVKSNPFNTPKKIVFVNCFPENTRENIVDACSDNALERWFLHRSLGALGDDDVSFTEPVNFLILLIWGPRNTSHHKFTT